MKRRIVTCFLVLAAITTGWAQNDRSFETAKSLDVFNTIYKNLDMLYVDSLDASETVGTAIKAMLKSLDPYTEYYPEEELHELKSIYTGNVYAGIGSTVHYSQRYKNVCINEPYEGTPAAEAGLRMGDIILSVDDTSMVGKPVAYVSSHLRGEAGTSFVLKIKRPSTGKVMQMKITRRQIQNPTIPYYGLQKDSIGYTILSSFTENCSKEVRRAFIDLKRKGMKALVFDLRGNGGGSEQEAVSIVNMFVPKGELIVSNRGRVRKTQRDYKTTVEPIDTLMPIVVMVNGNSASASEITSGSMQDLDRAVILGTRTYGKGLVQVAIDLPYNGSLKLTTNKYYIPSGRCIQAINYRHGKGGYTEHIPDSLTKVFYTRNGREVRDGGGIKPDVEVKPDSLANMAWYLQNPSVKDSSDVLFEYELDYFLKHPTLPAPSEFHLTDADYAEFSERVVNSGFSYDPGSEKVLENLKEVAKLEGYYDDAKAEFEQLEKKLKHNLEKDLKTHEELIRELLETEIVSLYYFQRGGIEVGLRYDKQFKEACRILNDRAEYERVLHPAK